MNRNSAILLFFGTCVVIGTLVVLDIIPSLAGAIIFVLALVLFGLSSRRFKK